MHEQNEQDTDILVIGAGTIAEMLTGNEADILEAVSAAYQAHRDGLSSLPHSLFLRFPHHQKNRIIALPAYLGGTTNVTGMKWISSFPDNLALGLDRASAVMIMNSTETGRPQAILEGSLISAKRTAASAALAAKTLHADAGATVGIVGCGVISFEIVRFAMAAMQEIQHIVVFDLYPARAQQFQERVRTLAPDRDLTIEVADNMDALLQQCPMIFIATTAIEPYLSELPGATAGTTILHVSLRDLTPDVILASDNLVDDIDHVMRAQTSVHLAELQVGNRDFIRGTLADVLSGAIPARLGDRPVVFSPFGLGILDLALGKVVLDRAREMQQGTSVTDFLPQPWERTTA